MTRAKAADAVRRLRANALECLGTRIGLHMHAEADAVEALMAEADALRAEAATMREWAETAAAAENANAADLRTMRAERDRYREAAGRLRDALYDLLTGEVSLAAREVIADALAATTDDALADHDAPPAPDARLLAKANAALVVELAELRAKLATMLAAEAESRRLGPLP